MNLVFFLLKYLQSKKYILFCCSHDIGNSFEHDFVEDESGADQKELSTKHLAAVPANTEHQRTVWNAKVNYSPCPTSLFKFMKF